jgi:hypothetical protein
MTNPRSRFPRRPRASRDVAVAGPLPCRCRDCPRHGSRQMAGAACCGEEHRRRLVGQADAHPVRMRAPEEEKR